MIHKKYKRVYMEVNNILIIGILSILVMVLVSIFFRHRIHQFKEYGYLGIFLLCLIGNINVFSPASFTASVIGGRYYNPLLVGFIAALGSILGEILAYNVGAIGQLAIKDKEWFEPLHQNMEKNGFFTILFVTAIPNPIFNFAAGGSGALNYPLGKFLFASFLGNWLQYSILATIGKVSNIII